MKHEQFAETINTLLKKNRSFQVPGDSFQPVAPGLIAFPVALSVTVVFILLRYIILQIVGEGVGNIAEMHGRITFALFVFLLFPGWVIALVLYAGGGKRLRSGSWISTRHALFYKSPNGDASVLAWKDVYSISKRFDEIVVSGKRRFIFIPMVLSNTKLSYLWFINRVLEDFGSNRPEAKPLREIQKKLMLEFLRPCVDRPWGIWINCAWFLFFPTLFFLLGHPFCRKYAAGTDHVAFLLFMNGYIFSVLLSPILGFIPVQIREKRVRRRVLDYFEKHIVPRLNDHMPRGDRNEILKRNGRREVPFVYPTEEEVEAFLSVIPQSPRRMTPEVRRWFLFDGSAAPLHCFTALFLGLFSVIFLLQTSETQLRNIRFWNWMKAGTGSVVHIEPDASGFNQGRKNGPLSEKIIFSYNHHGEQRIYEDTRTFQKGAYTSGQNIPLESYRGDSRYLRVKSNTWHKETEMFVLFFGSSFVMFFCLIFGHLGTYFWEGPKRMRQWEHGIPCLGKVVEKYGIKTLLRCRFPDGSTKEIPCWGFFGQKNNKGKPFPVMIDPDDPTFGRKIEEPIFTAIYLDKEKAELVVDQKMYRFVYLALVLWGIALIPIGFTLIKLFGFV